MKRHVLASAVIGATACSDAQAAPLSPSYDFSRAIAAYALSNSAPPGANDWSCRPSASHPRPVVLVHGTGANMALSWQAVSPELRNRGFCVFALNYGRVGGASLGALAPVSRSARQLAVFVDQVLDRTGAEKVDIVGHSQGGMMPRQYLRFEGGATKVGTLVGLASSNYGIGRDPGPEARLPTPTELFLQRQASVFCGACVDQTAGSLFLRRLNEGSDTVPGVRHVVIQTRYDQIVAPYTNALLRGPGAENILVQDGCEQDRVDHAAIAPDRRAVGYVVRALDPAETSSVPCTRARPWVGG